MALAHPPRVTDPGANSRKQPRLAPSIYGALALLVMLALLALLAWRILKLFLPSLHVIALPIISQDVGKLPLVPFATPTSQEVLQARSPKATVAAEFLTTESFGQLLTDQLSHLSTQVMNSRDTLLVYVCAARILRRWRTDPAVFRLAARSQGPDQWRIQN